MTQRRPLTIALAAAFVVALGPACHRRGGSDVPGDRAVAAARLVRPIEPGTVGTAEEINAGIRRQLRGTRSRCEEGPPSAESRAEWKRLRRPRELESMPLGALVKKDDADLVLEVNERLDDRLYTVGLGAMTRAEQNAYLMLSFEAEVMNGGFQQYFANSAGNCAARAQVALAEMEGFAAWAAVLRRALRKFPGGQPPEDRTARGEQMDAMKDEYAAWSLIEDDYFKLPSSKPVLAAYIRGHVRSFPEVVPRP